MKTKCQFTSYKSTIKFSYSQPPKKNKEKKKAKNAPATKTKNAMRTQQLRDKKLNFGSYLERHEDHQSTEKRTDAWGPPTTQKNKKERKRIKGRSAHGHERAIFHIEKYDWPITGGRFFAYRHRHFDISLSISSLSITVIGPGGWVLVVPTEMQFYVDLFFKFTTLQFWTIKKYI